MGEHLRNTAELGLAALEAQQHVLGEEVRPLLNVLQRVVGGEAEAVARGVEDQKVLDAMVEGVRLGMVRLQEIESELAWRREQMSGAIDEVCRRPARMLFKRTGLGRRVRGWDGSHWTHNADGEEGP